MTWPHESTCSCDECLRVEIASLTRKLDEVYCKLNEALCQVTDLTRERDEARNEAVVRQTVDRIIVQFRDAAIRERDATIDALRALLREVMATQTECPVCYGRLIVAHYDTDVPLEMDGSPVQMGHALDCRLKAALEEW
jgi:hypothetical protein